MPRSSTTFRPGQSGNPRGRPRGTYGWWRRIWTETATTPREYVTPQTARELLDRALAGQVTAVRELCDVIEYGHIDPDDDGWDEDDDDA